MPDHEFCPIKEQACRTLVSLQDYLEARLDAVEKAASLARDTVEARLEILNESRGQLRDQAGTFATKDDLAYLRERIEVEVKRIEGDIRVLREFRSELTGKASAHSVVLAQGVALLGVLLAAIALIMGI